MPEHEAPSAIMWAVRTGMGRILLPTIAATKRRAQLLAMLDDDRSWQEMQNESGYRCIRVKVVEVGDGA